MHVGGHLEVANVHRNGRDLLVVHEHGATLAQELLCAQGLHGLERDHDVGAARIGNHGLHMLAHANHCGDRPTALTHAVDLGDLHVEPGVGRGHGEDVAREDRALPAHAHEQDGLGPFDGDRRFRRADVGDG